MLGTTSAALAELKQQQDATARQVAALLQMQAGLQASPGSPGPGTPTPAVPSTPNGEYGKHRDSWKPRFFSAYAAAFHAR